jgi:signal transduction histidine kinase
VRPSSLLRSSSFRLTLLYAGVFGGSVLVLLGFIYWATVGYLSHQLENGIETELATLADVATEGGSAALAEAIDDRLKLRSNRSAYYQARTPDGASIAGNIPPDRNASFADTAWHEFSVTDAAGRVRRVRGKAAILPDRTFLFVGQDTMQLEEVRELIGRAFLLGGAMMLVLAVGGGALSSRSILRRIDAINVTSEHIVSGDLRRRIPPSGGGDEFDRLAANLNAMLDRIERLMGAMKQISNDIAHDLRTPLTRLRNALENAQRHTADPAGYEAAIVRAIADTDAILETFGALLRIAQIEAGARRASFADVDLSAVVEAVLEVYAPAAEEKQQNLAADIAPGLRTNGDRELLMQLIANVCENAIRHSPPGTRIEVSLRASRRANESVAEVVIADHGPGIPVEERDKVFQRFYRLESSRTTPGSGLGLSLVAAIAEMHQIGIHLEDNEPGLRVVLKLPLTNPYARGHADEN